MIVMPSNSGKYLVHYWQGKFGGLGHLYSIDGQRGPFAHLPYALDNGRFPAFENGAPWDEAKYLKLLKWAKRAPIKPLWALVPDVVTDAAATLQEWKKWLPIIQDHGFAPAFAAQDGHTVDDVPPEAEVVFVGGSTDWKRGNLHKFCESFRVHVGRINTYRWLIYCRDCGVESVDGTGWFRGGEKCQKLEGLRIYLEQEAQARAEGKTLTVSRKPCEWLD